MKFVDIDYARLENELHNFMQKILRKRYVNVFITVNRKKNTLNILTRA